MLEFAREQWLWLFALVGVFYVAWWFARRYRKQRVTYGRIWERVAKKVLPPGWKRILRTVLTLLISGVLLSSVVLYAAGLQRPTDEQPSPLLVFIVLDNSPAMRVQSEGKTRAQLASERAQQVVDALGENDRALLAWRKDGRLLTGAWLKRGDDVGEPPATDWVKPGPEIWQTDLKGIPAPPDIPSEPEPLRIAFELGAYGVLPLPVTAKTSYREFPQSPENLPPRLAAVDGPWWTHLGLPTRVELINSSEENDGFWTAGYVAPESGDGTAGTLLFRTYGNGEVSAREMTTGKVLSVTEHPTTPDTRQVVLPIQQKPLEVRLSLVKWDALLEDNTLTLHLQPRQLSTVTICHPANETPNPILKETLELLLPGLAIDTRATQPGDEVHGDLLVCDRVLPDTTRAQFVLAFGVLPSAFGETSVPVDAQPNLQLRVEPPRDLGFEVPELTLIHGTDAVPLKQGHKLVPLARMLSGETLVGIRRGQPELLYSGFLPHRSTLLQDSSGLLLMLRWLETMQTDDQLVFPPFVAAEEETEFQLTKPGKLKIELAKDNPWLPSYGPKAFELTTGADGRGKLGPFTIPGEYFVLRSGVEVARFTALRIPPRTFSGFYDVERTDLDALFADTTQPDWRDYLPGALLWIALGLLMLEWLLWLVGVTE